MALGRRGELAVSEHLVGLGWKIVAMNLRCARGEIDIVASDDGRIIVCEVKTLRETTASFSPLESIGERKQLRVRRTAAAWLAGAPATDGNRCAIDRPPKRCEIRFDAFGVVVDASDGTIHIEHVRDAF